MNVIDRAVIAVGLDTSDVDKGMNRLQDGLRSGFSGIVNSVIAPALAAFGAFSAGDFLRQIGEEALSIQRYADMVGVSMERMSAWATVSDEFGFSVDDLVDKMTDLNDAVTDLMHNDSGIFKELQERGLMNITTDDGNLKSTEDILLELSDTVKALGAQEGTGLLKRLSFNDPRMISMIMQGGDALKSYLAEAQEIGVYQKEDAEMAREFNTALIRVTHSLKMSLVPIFRILSPLLVTAAKGLQFLAQHAIALVPAIIAVTAVLAARMIPDLIRTGRAIRAAFSWKRLGLLAALLALGIVLEDFYTWLQGGKSQFADLWEWMFKSTDGARAFLDELAQFADVALYVGGLIAALAGVASILSSISSIMTALGIAGVSSFGLVGGAIAAVIAALLLLWQNWDSVTQWAGEAWAGFCGGVLGAWNAITSVIDGWIQHFIDTWASIQAGIERTKEFFGFGAADVSLAGEGGGNTSNTVNQTNNWTITGNPDPQTMRAAAGMQPAVPSIVSYN